jgi:hypothetical protein
MESVDEFLKQCHCSQFIEYVKSSVGDIFKRNSTKEYEEWKKNERKYYKEATKKKRSSSEAHESGAYQLQSCTVKEIIPARPLTESEKGKKAVDYMDALKEKENPVKFVVDVDNIGSIVSILEFFDGYDVKILFFVKNSLHLEVPNFNSTQFDVDYEIVIVQNSDDDDFAILTEAVNENAFVISLDMYKTYNKSKIVSLDWIEKYKIPVTYRKAKLDNGQSITRVIPTIPKSILKRKLKC